ncbi:hypothetical protein LIER_42513 [Lithospermum erythrorhizon]|uniref:Uncharacterized protein n=1 Tax=Lithospermum erythrorhizon TaxID=34254 RepID=A0AAV3RSQ0_LITER
MLDLYRDNREWKWELGWLMNVRTSCKLQRMLLKISTAATIYCIWKERNSILHGESGRNEAVIIQAVVSDRMRGVKKLKHTRKDWELAVMWGLSCVMFDL